VALGEAGGLDEALAAEVGAEVVAADVAAVPALRYAVVVDDAAAARGAAEAHALHPGPAA